MTFLPPGGSLCLSHLQYLGIAYLKTVTAKTSIVETVGTFYSEKIN